MNKDKIKEMVKKSVKFIKKLSKEEQDLLLQKTAEYLMNKEKES